MPAPSRLGFAVKILGQKGLKSNDARRWQSGPHLSTSLEYLRQIFGYLDKHAIRMYRMSSDLAPYATHPDLPQFHNQVKECRKALREIGAEAKRIDLRLSFHPSQFIVINSPDPGLRDRSVWDLSVQSELLDCMEQGPEAVLVLHGGGVYGNIREGIDRWAKTWDRLPKRVQRRLVLENDDLRYSAASVLEIHRMTGVRLVFDVQHFCCLNPEGLPLRETVETFLRTWPEQVRPKLHFSSPRTELRQVQRKNRKTGKKETVLVPPVWTGHADYNHPFEFISFMRQMTDLDFDVMLESKAKDLALIRLRKDLLRYAPDVARRFGLTADVDEPEPEEIEIPADSLEEV